MQDYEVKDKGEEGIMPPITNRQILIVNKLKQYLKAVGRTPIFDLDFGLCSGLVALKLYSMRLDNNAEFERDIKYILNWDAEQFSADGLQSDSVIEDFLNAVIFLQADSLLREGVKSDELKQSVDLLLGQISEIADPEFKITFVFTSDTLLELLSLIARDGKMIRISTNEHAIGVSCMQGRFMLHDFSSYPSDIACNNVADLNRAIFKILTPWEKASQLTLHVTVIDLKDSVTLDYPDSLGLVQNWMRNPKYAMMVLDNPNLFHLAARYADYPLLDLLFAQGYTYKPWTKTEDSELLEAVMNQDRRTLAYLIKHGIPLNARTTDGVTALGKAITFKASKMLYKLLEAGADPNIEVAAGVSAIDIALLPKYKNRDNVILLLAFGAKITSGQLQQMYRLFGEDACYIVKHALAFNARLLKTPTQLDLNVATGRDVVAFLHHTKTCLLLETKLSAADQQAIEAIKELYKSKTSDLKWSFAEKAEIHKMLKLFAFDEVSALIQQINTIAAEITKIPFKNYKLDDIVRIAEILDELTDLAEYRGASFTRLHVSHLAAVAKRSVEAYLRRNGINNIRAYLRERSVIKPPRTTTAYFALNHGAVAAMDADYESVIIPELLRDLG